VPLLPPCHCRQPPTQPNGNYRASGPSKLHAPRLGSNKKFYTTAFYHDTYAPGHDAARVSMTSTQPGARISKPELVTVEVVVKAFKASLEPRTAETHE